MAVLIHAQDLTHRYGQYVAVDHINFAINAGECFGFLGPNGAGKTTTMRMIYCLSPVHEGSLTVFGDDVMSRPRQIKARLGVVPQEDNLDVDLTVLKNLELYGSYFGKSPREVTGRARELLRFMQLDEKRDAAIRQLSGGMRRRLIIARALIHQPEILVLDEPTTGLDPQARHLIWDQLEQLKQQGVTQVLTTHYMEEAAKLCDRLVIMDHAKILIEGRPADLVKEYVGFDVVEVRAQDHQLEPLLADVKALGGEVEKVKEHYYLFFKQAGHSDRVITRLSNQYYVHRPATLEDVFLKLTGRELEE